MKHFHFLFFLIGSFLLSTISFAGINQHNSTQENAPQAFIKNGSISTDLQKWNLSADQAPDYFNRWFDLNENYSYSEISRKTDKQQIEHIAYQVNYKNLPIDNSIIILHAKNGKAQYLNGQLSTIKNLNINTSITSKQALNLALDHFEISELIEEYPVEKVILILTKEGKTKNHITYRTKIASGSPLVLQDIYIDAQNGKILKSIDKIVTAEGTGNTFYYGNKPINVDQIDGNYRLRDNERNIRTYDGSDLSLSFTGLNGGSDVLGSSTDFIALELEELEISELSENTFDADSTYYYQIKKGENDFIYISNSFTTEDLPVSLIEIGYEVWNFDSNFEIEIRSSSTDDLITTADFVFEEGNISWDSSDFDGSYLVSSIGNPAIDAHWGMEQVYEFYSTTFDWSSYNNQGGLITQFVNPPDNLVGPGSGLPNNAFALQSPFNLIIYGLGDRFNMNPLVAIDVLGHEFTHLVIENNGLGGLDYEAEAGALNESFADIFGTSIEFFADAEPNWEIGEKIAISATNLRSMENPKNPGGFSQQADTYEGQFWINPSSPFDNGGVHYNSGVQNYWFYLLSEGGSGTNDNDDDYLIDGLGIEAAQEIAFNNLMNYMIPQASYNDAYVGAMQVAKDLYDIPSYAYTQTAKAWYAVGLADNPEEFCSGTQVITEPEGVFDDGSGSENYMNNTHCSWLIQPENAEFIGLLFLELNTEENADMVIIYDGEDNTAPILGEFSGNDLPEEVVSTGGSVFIEFYSDQADKRSGWKLRYATNKLSVDKNEMQESLTVSPNPTDGRFSINSDLNEAVDLNIYDINGRLVKENIKVNHGLLNMDISDLNSGIYFLKFQSGQKLYTEKLILN